MLIFGANVRSPRLQISPATTGRVFSRLYKRLGLSRSRPLSPSSTPTLPLSAFAQGPWSARPFSSPENRERSEEHTSELQSLLRISYAVFCFKTKQTPNPITDAQRLFSTPTDKHKQKKKRIYTKTESPHETTDTQ